nr:zeatin O-xylosyltransferase-like [Ipomoea batatas]
MCYLSLQKKQIQMDSCNNNVAVVMVPLPAQGHLNQLLQLCCLVSSYGHPVHYIGSAIHNQQARVRANGLDPKKLGNIFSGESRRIELPEGFEERVKGVGLVVRDWAPQPEILAHPATGGFMSHCGWNSCMESITLGVPIAAWPMHSDQPSNSFLVARILKTGLIVREWGERHEVVKSSGIENVVRRLMASEEGDEIRKRAQELGETIRKSAQEGGTSRMELDSFIAHITR